MLSLTLAAVAAAAGLAGFTQAFAGFGSTLVALPLMGLVLDVRTAVPVGCLMALSINIVLATRLRSHIQRGPLGWLLAAALPGMAAGAWATGLAPAWMLKALLGASVLLVALDSMRTVRPAATGAPSGRGWAAVAGLVSGCTGVLIGINGPPVVAWAARQPWTRQALRATLTGYFLLAGVGIVSVQTANGQVTSQVLGLYAATLPSLAVGMWAGWSCCGKVREKSFRYAVLSLLALTGAVLVWQATAGA